tara:strand:- start:200 stop:376 length:177 start_codon:yes stop_codon:yes gene_type:complete
MKALRDNGYITHEVFMIKIVGNEKYIKFGGYDKSTISGDINVLECSDPSSYSLDMKSI